MGGVTMGVCHQSVAEAWEIWNAYVINHTSKGNAISFHKVGAWVTVAINAQNVSLKRQVCRYDQPPHLDGNGDGKHRCGAFEYWLALQPPALTRKAQSSLTELGQVHLKTSHLHFSVKTEGSVNQANTEQRHATSSVWEA